MSQSPGRFPWQIDFLSLDLASLEYSGIAPLALQLVEEAPWTLPCAGLLWVWVVFWGTFLPLCLCGAGERAVTWLWPLTHTVWAAKAVKQGFSKPGPHSLF